MLNWSKGNFGLILSSAPENSTPEFIDVASNSRIAAGLTQSIAIPGTRVAGDILIAAMGLDESGTITWPADWNDFGAVSNASTHSGCAWKISDGTETTVIATTTNNEPGGYGCMVFRTFDQAVNPESASDDNGGVGSDPAIVGPNLAPSWGATGTMWVTGGSHDSGSVTSVTPPTGYTLAFWEDTGTSTGAGCAFAYKTSFDASDNPDGFDVGFTTEWTAYTIGIKGRAGPSANTRPRITEAGTPDGTISQQRLDEPNVRLTEDGQYRFTE